MRLPEDGPANAETDTVQVSLKYGKGSVRLEIPKDRLLEVVKPRPSIRRGQSILEALSAPVGTDPLPRLVDRNDKVAVVVSDITRPCPTGKILPFVMRSLEASGVPRDNVRILIGTGTHRGHTSSEKHALLGSYASSIPQVVDHSMDSVQYVGTTKRGIKVSVNPLLLDTDFALAIGNVDVHYFAGYTGGYKAVVPGLAGKETIERNHSLMTLPYAEPAVVESNPVREDLEEAGQMTGLRYVVNVVQDERKRIVSSFAGDPIAAQRAAVKTVDDLVKVPVRESADIVVASAGGYPRDINLYQAHKAIENASHAVKNGGTIILVAECREGFGNSTFENWMTSPSSLDEVGEKLSKHFILGAHKAFALSKIAKRVEIIVASNKLQANSIILRTCKKPQDALDAAWGSHGKDASILLMPYAMNTLPETPSDL
jgi:nickel-dependent lactate racemase